MELAADALWSAGATAVEERDNGDGTITLVSDVAPGGRWRAELVPVTDDGLDAWRPFARAWRAAASSRLVVQPPWVPSIDDARPDDVVLIIDPGRAFGSGSHVTTRLMLAELESRLRPGGAVLDVGCGSGVLAIGAARLGSSRVVAIDVEPAAVQATIANAEANGVGAQIDASTTPIAEVRGRFDLVAANLSVSAISRMRSAFAARVDDGGLLLVSGLLNGS